MEYARLDIFMKRMKKLNINIELVGNFPWVYITKINGKPVIEKFMGNHGFTICFLSKDTKFTDITEIFKLIRKYI